MKLRYSIVLTMCLLIAGVHESFSQAENVPVDHPVYRYLKILEVKRIIERYHDAVLPLSRNDVIFFLQTIQQRENQLTDIERSQLRDFLTEFEYELSFNIDSAYSLLQWNEPTLKDEVKQWFSEKEKYLYTFLDSNLTLFVDGLLTMDARRSQGDALGEKNAVFVQFGGRLRGTIYNRFGYYLQGTNAQFWGSREVLRRDKFISQAHTLSVTDAQNFDFVHGYVRYDAGVVSLQVGRERLLWGNGYGDKLIASDNVREYDFIRGEAEYKSLKYTYLHAWLLGKRSNFRFTLPSDTASYFDEPLNADKYFASHRLEFSFPKLFDIGFQEMVIYSNRSVDLAYLNPVTLIESAQRSRGERDNVLWAFDVQTHFIKNLEFQGTILFDDINFPKWGTNSVQNKFAYQIGALAVDPFGVSNTSIAVEYTRIEPFTFSHNRSRDNDYGSQGKILSHHIGSNSESWFFRTNYQLTHRLFTSLSYEMQRKGENVYGEGGRLMQNVGSDILQPHRPGVDSDWKDFLGGNLVRTNRFQALLTYEIINEFFLDGRFQYEQIENTASNITLKNQDYGIALRIDF
jgi:hypothetical protein